MSEERQGTGLANLKAWHIPQCPFEIECSPEVLEQVRRAVESSRSSPRGERETGGVLFGIQEPGRICIVAAKPLESEHAMGPGFVLSEKDEKRLAELSAAPAASPNSRALQALGWYHSHLRSRIFLSERDLQIHGRYFAAPFQVALVIRPESERPTRAGFFFRDASGEMRTDSSYEEFSIEAPAPAAAEVKQAAVPRHAPTHKHKAAPAKPEPPKAETICPKCGSGHLRRSRKRGPAERFRALFGFQPYRCHECLSRSFLKTGPSLQNLATSTRQRRPEERKRARQRTRREVLLWGGGVFGFLAILYYLIRDTGPKPDAP